MSAAAIAWEKEGLSSFDGALEILDRLVVIAGAEIGPAELKQQKSTAI